MGERGSGRRTMLALITKAAKSIGNPREHCQIIESPWQLIVRVEAAQKPARRFSRAQKLSHWRKQRRIDLHMRRVRRTG